MSPAGRRALRRRGLRISGRELRPLLAILAGLAVMLVATYFLGRASGSNATAAAEFTGVVTSFADDGRVLCVDPDDSGVPTPFCDLFYLTPNSPEIEIGDHVLLRTMTSTDTDGSTLAGVLVTAVDGPR
jgi:hypothetical protein